MGDKKPNYMTCLLARVFFDMMKHEAEETGDPDKVLRKYEAKLKNMEKEWNKRNERQID